MSTTTNRTTAKEAVATVLGVDIAEMNDARYQPTVWTMSIWDFGHGPYTARKIGARGVPVSRDEHVMGGPLYAWKRVGTWRDWEVLEGTDTNDADDDDENDAAFNMRPTRRARP